MNEVLIYMCHTLLFSKNQYGRSMCLPTSRKRSPKGIISPASTNQSAFALLALEMIDSTPGDLVCKTAAQTNNIE